MAQFSGLNEKLTAPSTFGERLAFVIWWAGKVLGIENAAQFAEAIGKRPSQISKWISEKPRPGWESIKQVADPVGISAVWLDEPAREGAIAPAEFSAWLTARRTREAAYQPKKKIGPTKTHLDTAAKRGKGDA